MKFLYAGLGNVGNEYEFTRHNIGFEAVDAFAQAIDAKFALDRHAFVAQGRFAGKDIILIKPTTYMNLSGKAVRYWLETEKIPVENMMVILDDIALPFGKIRIRKKGGDGNHNGLTDIIKLLGRNDFARMRFGIGNDFPRGYQSEYVLGRWNSNEEKQLPELVDLTVEIMKSFMKSGIDMTMNKFNSR
ncbi:MAG: aminoacyl-tRNA hydrolase [Bacteroidales bacterium]|nr:aminoacyl-tRNA hydrolase [Bacteroidales bacterium]